MPSGVTPPSTLSAPLISLRGICKSFPGVVANDHIDLDIFESEVHALLGENGAGKSTLVKILYGFYRADSGKVLLKGRPVPVLSPHDARKLRIGMVFQEFSLIPAFTVAENIALFLPDLKPVLDYKAICRRIQELSDRYGLNVQPQAQASQLSLGELQKVEILKLLLSDARLLILDEPTRVLAPHEAKALFQVLESLRNDGYAILLITHKLSEVLECAGRITVLRGGRVAGSLLRSDASETKLVSMMFEKEAARLQTRARKAGGGPSSPLLELRGVETRGSGAGIRLRQIDLDVRPGEIVGVAGVSGNGQKELTDLILGIEKPARGTKWLFGKDRTFSSVQAVRRAGVAFIPENPLAMAFVPFMTVLENMALTKTWRYAGPAGLWIDWRAVQTDIEATADRLEFTVSMAVAAKSLSGGNQQRMVIVRELTHEPRLIIASYLTRGLDVMSTVAARQALIHAHEEGAGVLLISEDLDELFTLSDRLMVLFAGGIVGCYKPDETNAYEVGLRMTGSGVHNEAGV